MVLGMLFENFKNVHILRYVIYEFLKKVLGGPRPTCLVRVHCALWGFWETGNYNLKPCVQTCVWSLVFRYWTHRCIKELKRQDLGNFIGCFRFKALNRTLYNRICTCKALIISLIGLL